MACALAGLVWGTVPRSLAAQQFPHRAIISLPGYAAPILLDTIGFAKDLPHVDPDKAFAALSIIYKELGIPLTLNDPGMRYIGNLQLTKMHKVAGMQMSQVVECGLDMNGPRADNYRMQLVIVSRVDALADSGSRVKSSVVASGEDIQGPSKDPIPCASSGALESRIAELVRAHTRP